MPADHRSYKWIALLLGAIAIARLAATIPVFSQIIDEPSGIGTAATFVEAHRHILGVAHPPLGRLPAGVAMRMVGVTMPDMRGRTLVGKEDECFATGTTALFDRGVPYWKVLISARIGMLVFPCVALLYTWLLARRLVNPLSALLTVALFSFDATLLGNGMWVTNDVAACAGFLALMFHGLVWIDRPTWKTAAIAGIAAGCAIGTKFSTVPAIPLLVVLALVRRVPIRKVIAHGALCGLVAFFTLWAIYLFDVGPMGDSVVLGNAPEWERVPAWIKNMRVPMPAFWLGLARMLGRGREGHPVLFLGEFRQYGWWYFFPFIMAVKTPVAFLASLLVATILWIGSRDRWRWPFSVIVLPPILFLITGMTSNLSLGIRYMLPMLPFMYLFIVWQFCQRGQALILIALIVAGGIEVARVHPDYIAYFNFASGGPENGDRFVVGSDIDWGQDVYRLSQYLKSPEAAGRKYTIRLSGLRQEPLVAAMKLDVARLTAPPEGLYCVNKRYRLQDYDHSWLAPCPCVKHIGYSIDVYDLDVRQPAQP